MDMNGMGLSYLVAVSPAPGSARAGW
jgi:hypothetical protein